MAATHDSAGSIARASTALRQRIVYAIRRRFGDDAVNLRNLVIRCRDEQFAATTMGNATLVTVAIEQRLAFNAELRLQRSCGVEIPAWITSLLRELVPVPIASAASSTRLRARQGQARDGEAHYAGADDECRLDPYWYRSGLCAVKIHLMLAAEPPSTATPPSRPNASLVLVAEL